MNQEAWWFFFWQTLHWTGNALLPKMSAIFYFNHVNNIINTCHIPKHKSSKGFELCCAYLSFIVVNISQHNGLLIVCRPAQESQSRIKCKHIIFIPMTNCRHFAAGSENISETSYTGCLMMSLLVNQSEEITDYRLNQNH